MHIAKSSTLVLFHMNLGIPVIEITIQILILFYK